MSDTQIEMKVLAKKWVEIQHWMKPYIENKTGEVNWNNYDLCDPYNPHPQYKRRK